MKTQLAAWMLAERVRLPGPGWVRRYASLLYLTGLILAVGGGNLLWTSHLASESNKERCVGVVALSRIPVPHPVAGHPSRQFAAAVETIYRQRARQYGCR